MVWLATLAAARLGPDLIWASHPIASRIDAAGLLDIELHLAVFAAMLAAVYLVAYFVGRIRYR